MKKIAVFTSGGDAPGMNACIRAIVRGAAYHEVEVFGIVRGYNGMIKGDIIPLNSQSVSNIIQRGGTILKSARSKEFMTTEGRLKAYDKLQELGITRELKDNIDTWSYENLNEAGRIASLVKSKMKSNGII